MAVCMTIHGYHTYNFHFKLLHQKILSAYNIAAVCCNSHVQENMLSSNRFTSIQGKTISRFHSLGCHCKILGCHFDTQKQLKTHCNTHMYKKIFHNTNTIARKTKVIFTQKQDIHKNFQHKKKKTNNNLSFFTKTL